jgi:hypothetical protein
MSKLAVHVHQNYFEIKDHPQTKVHDPCPQMFNI